MTVNHLNSGVMSNIFRLSSSNRAVHEEQLLNLETIRPNQINVGEKYFDVSSSYTQTRFEVLLKGKRCTGQFD